jgi:hypothetical protein
MVDKIINLVDLGVDPVNVGRDLGVNSRVGRNSAGLDGPRHDASLISVDEERAAGVTLKFTHISQEHIFLDFSYAALSFATLGNSSTDIGGVGLSSVDRVTFLIGEDYQLDLLLNVHDAATGLKLLTYPIFKSEAENFFLTYASPHPTRVPEEPPGLCWSCSGSATGDVIESKTNGSATLTTAMSLMYHWPALYPSWTKISAT